jgi:CRP-like cAMP-binding protein
MEDETLITKVQQICKKKPNERTNSNLKELQELTKNSKIFKSLIETNGESAHLICCKYLLYEFCNQGEYLFKIGDQGSRFYIIISGEIGVEVMLKDEVTGDINITEVVQIGKGGSFGELALESSKPRAASIRCKLPSHFVALEKADYTRLMSKLVRDKRNQIVNFLQSLPIFSNTTKGSLSKLTYNFKEKEYFMNQIVYKEGDLVSDIFIIINGEFLFQKKIKVDDGRKLYDINLGIYDEQSEIKKYKAKSLHKKLIQVGTISRLTVGEIFGIEELEGQPKKFTCVCSSTKAKILCIPKSDFDKRIKEQDVLTYITQRKDYKNIVSDQRIKVLKYIAEKNAMSLTPLQQRRREKDLSKTLEITPKLESKSKKFLTRPFFSKTMKIHGNDYIHKIVDAELKNFSPRFTAKHKSSSPVLSTQSKSISPSKNIQAEKPLTKSNRNLKPIPSKTLRTTISVLSMNSKHIYDTLK